MTIDHRGSVLLGRTVLEKKWANALLRRERLPSRARFAHRAANSPVPTQTSATLDRRPSGIAFLLPYHRWPAIDTGPVRRRDAKSRVRLYSLLRWRFRGGRGEGTGRHTRLVLSIVAVRHKTLLPSCILIRRRTIRAGSSLGDILVGTRGPLRGTFGVRSWPGRRSVNPGFLLGTASEEACQRAEEPRAFPSIVADRGNRANRATTLQTRTTRVCSR